MVVFIDEIYDPCSRLRAKKGIICYDVPPVEMQDTGQESMNHASSMLLLLQLATHDPS